MRSQAALLPRSTPAASGVSSRSIAALLDRIEERSVECHSIIVVRHGHVVAEGWWAPYSAGRPHLLYSLTKSFTSIGNSSRASGCGSRPDGTSRLCPRRSARRTPTFFAGTDTGSGYHVT